MRSSITIEGRKKLAELVVERQTGKTGLNANASKGIVVCEYEDGSRVEAGSALQLSKIVNIPQSTISFRLKDNPGIMKKGYKIYYKVA